MLGEEDVTLKCDVHAAGMEEPASGWSDTRICDDVLMPVVVQVEFNICDPILRLPFLDYVVCKKVLCNAGKGLIGVLEGLQKGFGEFGFQSFHSVTFCRRRIYHGSDQT